MDLNSLTRCRPAIQPYPLPRSSVGLGTHTVPNRSLDPWLGLGVPFSGALFSDRWPARALRYPRTTDAASHTASSTAMSGTPLTWIDVRTIRAVLGFTPRPEAVAPNRSARGRTS